MAIIRAKEIRSFFHTNDMCKEVTSSTVIKYANYFLKCSSKDPYKPLNYREISLLSCVSKVFTCIINNHIVCYCEENNVYEYQQNGFRKKRSCEDHIFTLTSILRNRMTEGKYTFCAFIDMQKAFDWVDQDLLFYRLLKYNLTGSMYYCIKALYSHPIACVKVNNYVTNWFDIKGGVHQEDSLSLTLFGLFLNDLLRKVNDLKLSVKIVDEIVSILAFADDIVIFVESEKDLQTILKCIANWLKVNTEKTNVIHFRKKRRSNYF